MGRKSAGKEKGKGRKAKVSLQVGGQMKEWRYDVESTDRGGGAK